MKLKIFVLCFICISMLFAQREADPSSLSQTNAYYKTIFSDNSTNHGSGNYVDYRFYENSSGTQTIHRSIFYVYLRDYTSKV
ncbi:MAG: hypothetical protein JEY94_13460 [Melioribacteraceae bacterium]|nr:hypothetical protein [Melioribacteraceae bacterium]